ncbi:hypothetical protein AS145_05910 [Aeromonas hydrophila]|nr:hypothetical protein AS145_05910 [Aeromonas hydrophila]
MALFHQQFAIVFPLPFQQIVQCHFRGISGQVRILEHGGGRHMAIGLEHQIPGTRQLDRLQPFTDPLGKGRLAAHEHRHVGAQLHAELGQLVFTQAGPPQVVEGDQGGGGVRRTAADAAAHGQYLLQPDMGSLRAWQFCLQQAGGADDQVLLVGHTGNGRAQGEQVGIGERLELEPVAVVEEDEQSLQLVVAVRATAVDVQKEIQFGRSRPAHGAHGGVLVDGRHQRAIVHWLICSLRRLPWPVMVSRCGRR